MQKVLFFQTKLKLQNCATTSLRHRMKLVSHLVLPYDIIFTSPIVETEPPSVFYKAVRAT